MNIELKNIQKRYGSKQVLKGVNLSVSSGKCVGILGENGSGKSTLLSILAGIQSANGGEFLLNDRDLFKNPKDRSKFVGYVPQGTPLLEELTAYDNLLLWYNRKTIKKELESGFLKMLRINEFLKVPVRSMSGGMKKRLSIGCAISKKPPILLLDEPMAALDLICKKNISEYIINHKKAGGIVFLATHDVLELELCDEWYIMKNGVISRFNYTGNIEELVKSL